MKEIYCSSLYSLIKEAFHEINSALDPAVLKSLKEALIQEVEPLPLDVLQTIMDNAVLAPKINKPLCQDTGLALIFAEIGQEVHFVDGDFHSTLQEAVADAYTEYFFRASVVEDPVFGRKNTGNNTPAIIHTEIVPGNELRLICAAKGGGAENMSALRMLTPNAGLDGIRHFLLETVKKAGGQPCPPIIIGMGIGGNFEHCALLAKKAILRPLTEKNAHLQWGIVENEFLGAVNALAIGPQGLGGKTTALAVQIETAPCHIASLPVAINIQCHSHRIRRITL
jgi:fumarate hydratase subunit alpha